MSAITITSLACSFSYALLYSLWQGLLVYAILFILLRAFPGLSARAKYNISFVTLAGLFAWFADTWESQYSKLKGVTVYISQASVAGPAQGIAQPLTANANMPAHFDIFREYLPLVAGYVPVIMTVYSVGLLFMLLRFMVNVLQLRALTRKGVLAPAGEITGFVSKWQAQLGIGREVRLYLSSRVNVPMMLGTLRPVILLPVAIVNHLSTEQVEAILMHELAHIRRHDYLFNILQTVAETVLFFNPFVWMISSVIRREREHCCDDLVVACAADPINYARALAQVEHDRLDNTNKLSLAVTGNRNQLFNRIKRIMEMKNTNAAPGRYSLVAVTVAAVLFAASIAAFTPSFAQKNEEARKTPPKKVSTTKTVTVDDKGKKKVVTKTTSRGSNTDDDGDGRIGNVNVSVTMDDDNDRDGKTKARVVVISDDKDGNGKKKIKREMVISSSGCNGAHAITIDGDDIEREMAHVRRELANVDWDEIGAEISGALADVEKELNLEQLGKQIRVEIKKELEHSREALKKAKRQMEESRKEMAYARAARGQAMASAMAGDDEVSSDSDDIEDMLDKMEKDGLINRDEKFKIEKEDGELSINGAKQPESVMKKYGRYMKGREVTIKGGKGNLNINVNN